MELRDYRAAFTPARIADDLVTLAELEDTGMIILDPCAGEGAIPAAILRAFPRIMKGPNDKPSVAISVCEINPEYHKTLFSLNTNETGNRISMYGEDFLNIPNEKFFISTEGGVNKTPFDRVIMNPPFDGDMWCKFIIKAYSLLKPKGMLVAVIPKKFEGKKEGAHYRVQYEHFMANEQTFSSVNAYDLDNWVKKSDGTPSSWEILVLKIVKDDY